MLYSHRCGQEVSIDELGSAEVVKLEDKLVVQQDGGAKQVSFDTVDDLLTYVKEVAQTTTGSGDGGTNIITMTLSNGSTVDFSIKNVVSPPEKVRSF